MKKAPGEYSWRGEDKNASPPEQEKDVRKSIESSSKLQKISFTQITLLDKSSVDQSGDSCAKQRIFNGFYGASYTIPGLRQSFGEMRASIICEGLIPPFISEERLCPRRKQRT